MIPVAKEPSAVSSSTRITPSNSQIHQFEIAQIDDCEKGSSTCEIDSLCPEYPCAISPTVKVYLKLKPQPKDKRLENEKNCSCLVLDSSTLLTRTTQIDRNCASTNLRFARLNENVYKRFSFSKIFEEDVSQTQFFDEAVKQQIANFLAGQSSTVMAYGTTNSGKTYTLFGTPLEPGVIPRSIEHVFSVIICTLLPWYKFDTENNVISLDEYDRVEECSKRNKLLNLENKDRFADARRSLENSKHNISGEDQQEEECNGESMYAVWLSFVEIYNENVYDLLDCEVPPKTRALKLITDKNGLTHVKGATNVYATTALEACRILVTGQSRLSTASTTLNAGSSRSHSIFTMKMMKYQQAYAPHECQTSTLSFYDLAGSGRSKKIFEKGQRLVEARNINNSLLVLGRCLTAVHSNHSAKQNSESVLTAPFRESKLTRLCQNALCAREHMIFIVNVDPTSELTIETQSALNVAAVMRKLTNDSVREAKKLSSFATPINSKMSSVRDVNAFASSSRILDNSKDTDSKFPEAHNQLDLEKFTLEGENPSVQGESDVDTISTLKYEHVENAETAKLRSAIIEGCRAKLKQRFDFDSILFDADIVELCQNILFSLAHLDIELSRIGLKTYKDIKMLLQDSKTTTKILQETLINRQNEFYDKLLMLLTDVILDLEINCKVEDGKSTGDVCPAKMLPSIDKKDVFTMTDIGKNASNEASNVKAALLKRELEVRQELVDHYTNVIEELERTWKERTKEVEAEGQDLLKWSVKQVENFYKERIDSIMNSRKRKRNDANYDTNDECETTVDLEAENAEITSKVMVLRDTLKKLKNEHQTLMIEKNECSYELALVKKELEAFKDFTKSQLAKQYSSGSDDPTKLDDSVYLVETLKNIFNGVTRDVRTLRKNVDDTRNEYETIKCEHDIKSKELSDTQSNLAENLMKMDNMEKQLSEKTREVDTLLMQLQSCERKMEEMKCDFDEAERKNVALSRQVEKFERTVKNSNERQSFVPEAPFFLEDGFSGSSISPVSDRCNDDLAVKRSRSAEKCELIVQAHVDTRKKQADEKFLRSKYTAKKISLNICDAECANFFDVSATSVFRSSDVSSKNDSGIAIGLSSTMSDATTSNIESEEKSTQTTIFFENEKAATMDEKLDKLTKDKLQSQREIEMLEEMRNLKETVNLYAEVIDVNDRQIAEYKSKLENEENEVKRLTKENAEITKKYNNLSAVLAAKSENAKSTADCDLVKLHELTRKVEGFGIILEKCERERDDLRKQLHQRCSAQSNLEYKLKAFIRMVEGNESGVNSLKMDISNVIHLNASNSEKAKELCKQVSEMQATIDCMREGLFHSDELRRNIERTSKQEINELKAQLAAFEKHAVLFGITTESHDDRQEELNRLKCQLHEKEHEMSLFKKNRDATISKYESLVDQLQKEIQRIKERSIPSEHSFRKEPRKSFAKFSSRSSNAKPPAGRPRTNRNKDFDEEAEDDGTYEMESNGKSTEGVLLAARNRALKGGCNECSTCTCVKGRGRMTGRMKMKRKMVTSLRSSKELSDTETTSSGDEADENE